jgi:hypothetical protein
MLLFSLLRGSAGLLRYNFRLLEVSCVMESATAQLDKQRAIEVVAKPQTLSGNAVEESRHVFRIVECVCEFLCSLKTNIFVSISVFSVPVSYQYVEVLRDGRVHRQKTAVHLAKRWPSRPEWKSWLLWGIGRHIDRKRSRYLPANRTE